MRHRGAILLMIAGIVSGTATAAVAQAGGADRIRVEAAPDRYEDALAEFQEAVAKDYTSRREPRPVFGEWVHIETDAVRELFPGYHFAAITWEADSASDSETTHWLASVYPGLRLTAAVNRQTRTVPGAFTDADDQHVFFMALANRGTPLRDQADARLIWEAFCDLHQLPWKNRPFERIGSVDGDPPRQPQNARRLAGIRNHREPLPPQRVEWRFGIHEDVKRVVRSNWGPAVEGDVTVTTYWEVRTDPATHRILEWRKRATQSALRVPAAS
ncbi:MAG: hypothetical protein WD066_07775 [Planctomycetaceae bacterium]